MQNSVIFVAGSQTTLDSHQQFLELAATNAGGAYQGVLTRDLSSDHATSVVITTPTLQQGTVSRVSEIRKIIEERIGTRHFPGLIIFAFKQGQPTEDINDKTKIAHSLPGLSSAIAQLLALK